MSAHLLCSNWRCSVNIIVGCSKQMSVFKYFMKTFVHAICPARCRVGEGLLAERSVGVKEAWGTKTLQVNACMATVDHERQGQAAHRQYKSHTVVEFASGKSVHKLHWPKKWLHELFLTTLMEQQTVTFCCYPWPVCHGIKSAMHCSLRLAATMINHLTSIIVGCSKLYASSSAKIEVYSNGNTHMLLNWFSSSTDVQVYY